MAFRAEGHVNPTLGITKAFSDKGYDVHYISTEKYKKRLEAAGATVHLHRDLPYPLSENAFVMPKVGFTWPSAGKFKINTVFM